MPEKNIRVDGPAHARTSELGYPASPDARNYARLSYKNKRYHLGKYDSPESYATYAIWRATIDRTGDAPELASVRNQVQAFLASEPVKQPVYTMKWLAGSMLAASLIFVFGGLKVAEILSSQQPPQVDGIAMSETEILRVRVYRDLDAKRDARLASPESVAFRRALEKKLAKEGSTGVPVPELPDEIRRLAKPYFPDIAGDDAPGNAAVDKPTSGDRDD